MRRRYLLALGILLSALLALLALGVLPSLLGGGEVYYVTATPVDPGELETDDDGGGDLESIRVGNLSENRFPYTHEAVAEGVSDPYEDDRFGIKGSFTHTPFDEFDELELWETNATVADDAVLVAENGSYYRLEITTDPNDG